MLQIVNQTKIRIPRADLEALWSYLRLHLHNKSILQLARLASAKNESKFKSVKMKWEANTYHQKLNLRKSLTLVFLSTSEARKINLQFRGKDYATDVLSFSSEESDSLGELVLCAPVLKRQATQHDLSFRAELFYMVIHGVLHLCGMDHERSKSEEELMFRIQDHLWEDFLAR